MVVAAVNRLLSELMSEAQMTHCKADHDPSPPATMLRSLLLILFAAGMLPSCSNTGERRLQDMQKMSRYVYLLLERGELRPGNEGFLDGTFHDENGQPCVSWRLGLGLRSDPVPSLNKHWQSPENKPFDRPTTAFVIGPRTTDNGSIYTNVFGLVGPGTALTEFAARNKPDLAKLPDDVIVLLESQGEKVHWIEPGDIELARLQKFKKGVGIGDLKPSYPDGYLLAFADESVWYIRKDVPRSVISKFFTVEGARAHDRRKELGPYLLDELKPELPVREVEKL